MDKHTSKKRRVLKTVAFYFLGYVILKTGITYFLHIEESRGGYYPSDFDGVATSVIILLFLVFLATLIKLYKSRLFLWKKFQALQFSTRILIWASCFWMISVFVFVYIFEPFGYMYDREWARFWKIVFIPPLIIAFGLFSYLKMVKSSKNYWE